MGSTSPVLPLRFSILLGRFHVQCQAKRSAGGYSPQGRICVQYDLSGWPFEDFAYSAWLRRNDLPDSGSARPSYTCLMPAGLTLGIVGVGNLGGALAQGALGAGAVSRVIAADISRRRLDELADQIGAAFSSRSAAETAASADLVVAAVKPHTLPTVLEEVHDALQPGCAFLSVAAGVPIARIEKGLPPEWPVIRAMPNLALLVRESATALCANRYVSQAQRQTAEAVFRSVGTIVWVEESQMHAVTGLTGSGPAYVSLLIEGLAAGAVKKGLQPALAQSLACQLLYGTAKLLRNHALHPAQLRDRVTTPSGTTIAGLQQLESRAVRGALIAAVEAASDRSEELAET